MAAKNLVLQGTELKVGKSLLVAALYRYYSRKGCRVTTVKVGEETVEVMKNTLAVLKKNHDLIILEDLGNPTDKCTEIPGEAHIREDILGEAPVLLVGNIDRGGVFASLAGTLELMPSGSRERVAGLIINKYRGDRKRLEPGLKELEKCYGKPFLGVLPYLEGVTFPPDPFTLCAKDEKREVFGTLNILARWAEEYLNMPFIDGLLKI